MVSFLEILKWKASCQANSVQKEHQSVKTNVITPLKQGRSFLQTTQFRTTILSYFRQFSVHRLNLGNVLHKLGFLNAANRT
jgi:hypothetical protein